MKLHIEKWLPPAAIPASRLRAAPAVFDLQLDRCRQSSPEAFGSAALC